jgi:hypothetical protein
VRSLTGSLMERRLPHGWLASQTLFPVAPVAERQR